MLVITNCEQLTKKTREKVVTDFKRDPLTKDFAEMMTKGIYTVGFPDTGSLAPMYRSPMLKNIKEDIYPILQIVADARESFLKHEICSGKDFWIQVADAVCTLL